MVRNLSKKDVESILGLLQESVLCHVNHCDVCVGYGREYVVKKEFWRLQDVLRKMIKELDD